LTWFAQPWLRKISKLALKESTLGGRQLLKLFSIMKVLQPEFASDPAAAKAPAAVSRAS
jgi:hypothetical protein